VRPFLLAKPVLRTHQVAAVLGQSTAPRSFDCATAKYLVCSVTCCLFLAWAGESRAQTAQGPEPPVNRADADPTESVQAEYRTVVAQAITEFNAQRFAEARALFARGHELWPSARTLRTLGMTAFEMSMYPQALQELQASLVHPRKALDERQREQVQGLIDRTRGFVGRYTLELDPADVTLLMDGQRQPVGTRRVVLPVGSHTLVARAQGHIELRLPLDVQGGEDAALVVQLVPFLTKVSTPSESGPLLRKQPEAITDAGVSRVLPVAALGVGAAGLLAGGILAALVLDQKADLLDACPAKRCPPALQGQVEETQRLANYATAGLIVGGVGVITGVLLWMTTEPTSPSERSETAPLQLRLKF
jgi:hypothetical protein